MVQVVYVEPSFTQYSASSYVPSAYPVAAPYLQGCYVRPYNWLERFAIDVDLAFGRLIGLRPGVTPSAAAADRIASRLGIAKQTAKDWFHRGVGGFVALVARLLGVPAMLALGAGAVVAQWLNNFAPHRRLLCA